MNRILSAFVLAILALGCSSSGEHVKRMGSVRSGLKLDDLQAPADAATLRTTIGVSIGTDVQAYDTGLDALTLDDFDIATDLAPIHRWRASVVTESGGLVTAITDSGSGAKNFTASNSCARAQDGNGYWYLAPDGSADYYTAGVAADWTWLHDGTTEYVHWQVYDYTSAPASDRALLDTCGKSTTRTGFYSGHNYAAATARGPETYLALSSAGNFVARNQTSRAANPSGVVVYIFVYRKHSGAHFSQSFFGGSRTDDTVRTVTASTSAPAHALHLFRDGTVGAYWGGKLYEAGFAQGVFSDATIEKLGRKLAQSYGGSW